MRIGKKMDIPQSWDTFTNCELYAGRQRPSYLERFYGHNRNWNLILLHSGKVELSINGKMFPIEPGDLLLLPPAVPRLFSVLEYWDVSWVHFNLDAHLQYTPEWQTNEAGVMHIHLPDKEIARFEKLFAEIYELCLIRNLGWYRLGYCLIQEIILRGNMINQKGLDPEHLAFASGVLADFSSMKIEEIAGKCGLSRAAFFKKFKETFGVTPNIYREQLRLNKVREELEQSSRSIKEIAAELQFKSEFYLSARFKKMFGMSPTAYRKTFHSGE